MWITFYVYTAGMLQSKGWSRIMIKSRRWLVKDRSYVAYCLHYDKGPIFKVSVGATAVIVNATEGEQSTEAQIVSMWPLAIKSMSCG